MMTREERNAIRALKRLAKRWPKSLWLFAAGTTLWVMREPQPGEERHGRSGGVRRALRIEDVAIPCDGGDW